jgi:SPP1 gp7 family putative phage head morphogenesis protein
MEIDDVPDPEAGGWDSATEAAIAFLRDKLLLPDEEFYALEERARVRAFTVSGVADLDVMGQVWEAVSSAVENGDTFEEFYANVSESLSSSWGGEIPGRIETIFRTNVQSAYSAGRWQHNSSDEVRATHPFLRFVAILDGRTTDICEELHGTTLPADDDFWTDHQPPLHHNCRSDVQALTEDEAAELGLTEEAPAVDADEGFGNTSEEFEPDLDSRDPELASIYELKQSE